MVQRPSFAEFKTQFEAAGSRLIVLVPFGRGGVFFLQSLFDNHPQVLMYPGNFDFYNRMALHKNDWKAHWETELTAAFDTIPQSTVMNINTGLGHDGSEGLNIDAAELLRLTKKCMEGQELDKRTLFLAAHYAIAEFFGRDIRPITTILLHDHHHPVSGESEECIREDFPASRFLYTVKDPRANYYSQRRVRKILLAREGFEFKYNQLINVTCIQLYQFGLNFLEAFRGSAWIIRLEDVQEQRETYIRSLAEKLGLTFHPCLLETTFGGKVWRGDAGSKKPEAGFRKSADPEVWKRGLSPVRVAALEILLSEEIKALGYEPVHGKGSFYHWLALLLLPLWRYEDFGVLFYRGYYQYRKQTAAWKVVISDMVLYLRTTVGSVRRLFQSPRAYLRIPQTIFRSTDRMLES